VHISWGTKRVERKQGWVANFCALCRDVRAFRLVRVGLATHINHIALSQGKLVGHLIVCETCGLRYSTEIARYVAPVKKRPNDIEALIAATFPDLRVVHAERLAMEGKLKTSPAFLSAEQRQMLLLEPFVLMNPTVETRFKNSTQFDTPSGIGCLGTIIVGLALFILSFSYHGSQQDNVLIIAAVVSGIGVAYTLLQFHLAPGRYVRTRMMPGLARALRPLHPTREEIEACLKTCKDRGLKIGKILKPDAVWRDLSR
jgi:hypothetical protein